MKAISIQQPWAWAILHAGKDVENRTWTTRHRGEIAIHATRLQTGWKLPEGVTPPPPGGLVQKAVLGIVELVDVVSRSPSRWFTGPYGFVLRNPRLLPRPIACPGNQNIWTLPPAVARAVRAALDRPTVTNAATPQPQPEAALQPGALCPPTAARRLTVTQGNLDNNHLYLNGVLDLFPADVLGGAGAGAGAANAGRPVRVLFDDDSVETDVVRRRIFRRRGWLRRFFAEHRIRAGDCVLLERLGPYLYRLTPDATAPSSSGSSSAGPNS